jgi:glucose-6-phosphate 1-dehydrogenase
MQENTPTIFVIFGVTGDLAKTKLLISLYHLFQKKMMPSVFRVVGFSRSDFSQDDFKKYAEDVLTNKGAADEKVRQKFLTHLQYVQGDFLKNESYEGLAQDLKKIDDEIGQCTNKLFYLAVPPTLYEGIFNHLSDSGLTEACDDRNGWTRVLVEKPFGNDLKTAKNLDKLLGRLFREEQLFRIDHYLAKETMQNILAFRFSNSIFEPLWNKDHIEKIEVLFFEKDSVRDRGASYDAVGALRDVGQNHMLQMLALVTMETPVSFAGADVQAARAAALAALKQPSRHGILSIVSRGQYEGYREEKNVAGDSTRETYFRLKLGMSGERFSGVPLFLESGKMLGEEKMEVVIFFKKRDCLCDAGEKCVHQNKLTFRIQPQGGITLSLWTKRPGFGFVLEEKDLSFLYGRDALESRELDAYERVLFDCVRGDQTLFASTDELIASWRALMPILEGLDRVPLATYPRGSMGPGK